MNRDLIKEILIDQRESILRKRTGIEREILVSIEQKIKLPHILVITGIRRCGKSTLLRQIIKKYYKDKNFYYINFEDERLFDFNASDFNDLLEVSIELFGKNDVILFDEIQNVKNFEFFIRRLYDREFKIFLTGSNAQLLSSEISTKLTGRHVDLNLKPFSFREFLLLKNQSFNEISIYKPEDKAIIRKNFDEYILKGGMPEYLLFDDKEILSRIYEDIVLKDIAVRHNIYNVKQLKELYQFLITNFAKQYSNNSLKNILKFGSVNTIKKYIGYLEDTHFAIIISKFDYSLKRQISYNKKFYVIDNGFILPISSRVIRDRGWLLENLVLSALIPDNEVFYYQGKNECDFITLKENKLNKAIQVTWELSPENETRELNGLKEAMTDLNLDEGLILTYSSEKDFNWNNKNISILPVWKWMFNNKQ